MERKPRRDAQRNRAALIQAARGVFAEQGINASLEEIARRADLGIATLYRHFPERADLADAVLAEEIEARVTIGEEALSMPDPWDGFVHYLEATLEREAANRATNDLMSIRLPRAVCTEDARKRMYDLLVQLVDRAQRSGQLRGDLTPEDLPFLTWANTRIVEATGSIAPHAWRRHLGLLLDGLRASAATELDQPPMSPRQVYRAMLTLGRRTH